MIDRQEEKYLDQGYIHGLVWTNTFHINKEVFYVTFLINLTVYQFVWSNKRSHRIGNKICNLSKFDLSKQWIVDGVGVDLVTSDLCVSSHSSDSSQTSATNQEN